MNFEWQGHGWERVRDSIPAAIPGSFTRISSSADVRNLLSLSALAQSSARCDACGFAPCGRNKDILSPFSAEKILTALACAESRMEDRCMRLGCNVPGKAIVEELLDLKPCIGLEIAKPDTYAKYRGRRSKMLVLILNFQAKSVLERGRLKFWCGFGAQPVTSRSDGRTFRIEYAESELPALKSEHKLTDRHDPALI
jgi:hypothetical protein